MTVKTESCDLEKSVTGAGYGLSRTFEAPSGAEKTRISPEIHDLLVSGGAFNLKFGSLSGLANTLAFLRDRSSTGHTQQRTGPRNEGSGTRISEIMPNVW